LAVYCAVILGIRLPWPPLCHQSPLDALWDAYSDTTPFAIWHAMRGSGKTLLLAVLAYLESRFKPGCGTTILGGSLEQSTKAVMYLQQLWDRPGVPKHLLLGAVGGRGYKLTNGSWVQALAASQKSVRGPHPQKLRLDEVDEMDPGIFEASLGQPKANNGIPDQIVASSTLHNPFGLMSDLVDQRDEKGARLYQWCVEDVRAPRGFWTDDELDRKRQQLTTSTWEAEFLLKRPSIANTLYDYAAVERAFERGKRVMAKPATTEAGLDWGHTTSVLHIIHDLKDHFAVLKTEMWELTELNERCEAIADLCIRHKITDLYADSAPKDSNVTLTRILRHKRMQTRVHPIAFNRYKQVGINVMRFLLEKDLLDIAPRITKQKLQQYHYRNPQTELINKEDDHHADALTAWAASKSYLLGRGKQ